MAGIAILTGSRASSIAALENSVRMPCSCRLMVLIMPGRPCAPAPCHLHVFCVFGGSLDDDDIAFLGAALPNAMMPENIIFVFLVARLHHQGAVFFDDYADDVDGVALDLNSCFPLC